MPGASSSETVTSTVGCRPSGSVAGNPGTPLGRRNAEAGFSRICTAPKSARSLPFLTGPSTSEVISPRPRSTSVRSESSAVSNDFLSSLRLRRVTASRNRAGGIDRERGDGWRIVSSPGCSVSVSQSARDASLVGRRFASARRATARAARRCCCSVLAREHDYGFLNPLEQEVKPPCCDSPCCCCSRRRPRG